MPYCTMLYYAVLYLLYSVSFVLVSFFLLDP